MASFWERVQEAFSDAGPYTRWRIGIVAGWVVLSAASVVLAFSGGESNDIGAYVKLVDTGLGRVVNVENRSDEIWREVTVTLQPGDWRHLEATVRPGERFAVQVTDFRKPGAKGKKAIPPAGLRVRSVRVDTREGHYVTRLGAN